MKIHKKRGRPKKRSILKSKASPVGLGIVLVAIAIAISSVFITHGILDVLGKFQKYFWLPDLREGEYYGIFGANWFGNVAFVILILSNLFLSYNIVVLVLARLVYGINSPLFKLCLRNNG